MISQILFKDILIIPKIEAEKLNLTYEEILDKRIGVKENKLTLLESYYYIKNEEVTWDSATEKWLDKLSKEVASHWLFDPIPAHINIQDYGLVSKGPHLVNLLIFAPRCPYPFEITKSIPGTEETFTSQIFTDILTNVEEKLFHIQKLFNHNTLNVKTNVHIGGGLLASFNDLLLIEDSCTDHLQEKLNKGWRIIAVCVQPDQRRPDYILGRYNPDKDVTETNSKTVR